MLAPALPSGFSPCSLMLSESPVSPCVAGLLSPAIVVPRSMLSTATPEEIRWMLRHEHRHLLGMDSRWIICMALLRAVFWWNPFIHYLGIKWGEAREQVCDLHAAARADHAAYGELLIRMASASAAGCRLASSMVRGKGRGLRKRIVSLLQAPPEESNTPGAIFCSGTAGLLLALSLFTSAFKVAEDGSGRPLGFGIASAVEIPVPENQKAELPTLQVKLVSTVLFTPRAIVRNQEVLNREAWDTLREKTVAGNQNHMFGFPAVTCRNGEQATVEIIQENPDATADKPKAGWQLSARPVYDGKEMTLSVAIHYAFVPGSHYSPTSRVPILEILGEGLDWGKLVAREGSSKAALGEGYSLVTALGEVMPGWHATVVTLTDPIDRTGRTISRFEDAIYKPELPKEEVAGVMRLRGILLDDFKDFQTPEVDGVTTGIAAIFPAEHWKLVKDKIGGVPLGEVVLEAGTESEPWKELPGVKLAVRRYKGEPHIDVQFAMPQALPWNPKIPARYAMSCEPGTAIVSELMASTEGKRRGLIVVVEETK